MPRALACLALLLSLTAAAQVSEVIEVRVVEIEVVVVDGHGKPVSGLTKDDFELREGGKPREITNFYAVERGQLLREPAAAAPAAKAAQAEPPLPAPPTHLAFFVDNAHLDLRQRNRVLAAVRKFAEANVKEGVTASLITFDHDAAKVRVPFTSDRTKILAAIDELEHESPHQLEGVSERRSLMRRIDAAAVDNGRRGSGDDPQQIWRAVMTYSYGQARILENSVTALSDALKRLRGVPGRRVLVHVSSGLPLQPGIELMDYCRQAFHADPNLVNMAGLEVEKSNAFKHVIADAQAGGVTVDTIDAGGIAGYSGANVEDGGSVARLDSTLMRDNGRQTIQLLADETGGRAIVNENDFDRALLEIAADTTTYYSLGFRPESGSSALKHVEVRVKRPGLTVRSSKAYRDRTFDERIQESIESGFDFPLDVNPLGAVLAVGEPHEDGGLSSLPITLTVVPTRLVALPADQGRAAHVRCYYEVRDSNGGTSPLRVVDQDLPIDDGQAPVQLTRVAGLRLRRGRYTLSLAIRDLTTNETSYVQQAIEIR